MKMKAMPTKTIKSVFAQDQMKPNENVSLKDIDPGEEKVISVKVPISAHTIKTQSTMSELEQFGKKDPAQEPNQTPQQQPPPALLVAILSLLRQVREPTKPLQCLRFPMQYSRSLLICCLVALPAFQSPSAGWWVATCSLAVQMGYFIFHWRCVVMEQRLDQWAAHCNEAFALGVIGLKWLMVISNPESYSQSSVAYLILCLVVITGLVILGFQIAGFYSLFYPQSSIAQVKPALAAKPKGTQPKGNHDHPNPPLPTQGKLPLSQPQEMAEIMQQIAQQEAEESAKVEVHSQPRINIAEPQHSHANPEFEQGSAFNHGTPIPTENIEA